MSYRKHTITLSLALLAAVLTASAQEDGHGEKRFRFVYPVSRTSVEEILPESRSELRDMDGLLDSLQRTGGQGTRIYIIAGASPEGDIRNNISLAQERASDMESYIRGRHPGLQDITAVAGGEHWSELAGLLRRSTHPNRIRLALLADGAARLRRTGDLDGVESVKREMTEHEDGATWEWMKENLFPAIRFSEVTVIYELVEDKKESSTDEPEPKPEEEPEEEIRAEDKTEPETDTAAPPIEMSEPAPTVELEPVSATDEPETLTDETNAPGPDSRGGLLIYTNTAYLAGLAPNIGTVLHLGRGWAVDLRLGGAWWTNEAVHFCWRIYGGELALRKYFRQPVSGSGLWRSLTGHHVGLYAQLFTYDFEINGKGQIGGYPGKDITTNPQYGAGIEYGYTIALSRHLNLDLGLGVGYVGGLYHTYEAVEDKHIWRSTMRRHWIGPTRADITLQWLFGGAVNQKKKGGRR